MFKISKPLKKPYQANMMALKLSNLDIQRNFLYSTMMVQTTHLWNLWDPPISVGYTFLLHQNFRRLPKFRQSKSRKEKRECQSLFLRYSVLDNGFFCPSLLARAERRICICLQRRKCLKKHTNFVKYANHEVTEFWACKKWARTVLAFLSLQKIEWKLVNSSNVIYICFADAKTVWKSTNSLFALWDFYLTPLKMKLSGCCPSQSIGGQTKIPSPSQSIGGSNKNPVISCWKRRNPMIWLF